MIDTQHIQPEDLALYALRSLSPEESSAVEAHLGTCRECRTALEETQNDLVLAALNVELEAPPTSARERFMTQVQREKRVVAIDQHPATAGRTEEAAPKAARKPAGGTVLPWLGWAVAAGVLFFTVSQYHDREQLQTTITAQAAQLQSETEQLASVSAEAVKARAVLETLTASSAMRVTLNTTHAPKPAPQGRASYLASKGTLVFIANNLDPLPLDKVYELWIIPANGTDPIPAGTFHPDARGNASVVLPNIPKGVPAKALGVTMEAEGGSTKPTLPILMVGQ